MPGRLRQSAGHAASAVQEDGAYNIPGLDFDQSLTWRAGKAIPVADLLSRLQRLAEGLRNLEQGQVQAKAFRPLAQDLAHSNLLGHKDKGIRAWTLCCVVDILNICAPDAPFVPAQLRDIFRVVNNLLQNLDDPSNTYNPQHVYVLNSLTDTKSIVLITDLERSEELITPLFRICFDIVSGASQNASGQELAKSVEFQLRSMLVTIIDEASLPQEAIDVILSQFLRVDPRTQQDTTSKLRKQDIKDKKQDTLHLKDYPPAYNMAKSICTTCPEKMTAYVSQYVGTIIMNASAGLDDEAPNKSHGRKVLGAEASDDDDESFSDLRKAHRLIRELWRACPDVLINVIPQIEAELFADAASLRQLATETLGDIIAGIGISGPPPTTALDPTAYPLPSIEESEPAPITTNPLLVPASPKPFGSVYSSAFSSFIGRRVDKSHLVRNVWAIAVGRILLTDAGGIGMSTEERQTLLSGYAAMLKDLDDKVRYTAVQRINDFGYHAVINTLCADGGIAEPGTVLSTLAERLTDRKHNVREEAMSLLGQIWGTASKDIQNRVERVINAIGAIPSRVCNAMYVNDVHIHMQLDKSLYESLLPINFPPVKTNKGESQKKGRGNSQEHVDADHVRVSRILTFVRSLDVKASQIFYGIQKRQVDMSRVMKVFLKACEDYNGGVVDDDTEEHRLKEALTKYIQAIAKQYPEPSKATSDLWKFVKAHDRRNYQLIRFATGPEHDYRTMSKALKELTKRVKEGTPSIQATMETLQPLLYRSALIVYNRSHIPAIMEVSRTDESDLAETAHELLKEVSARNPEVLKTHIQVLCKELEDNAPTATKPEGASAADTLKACSGFARKYPAEVPKDRKFLAAMSSFATNSTSPRAAKHATTIVLTVSDKKELHAKELLGKAVKDCNPESNHYLARLATIAQVCLLAPSAATGLEEPILQISITDCLHKNRAPEQTSDTNAWENPPSDETVAKQLALKIMVNRCRSADEKANQSTFDEIADKVIGILMKLIENDGELTTTEDTPPSQRNCLRLTAAHYLLKLCSHKRRCEELVTPKMFISTALIVINPPNPVRSGFVQQLQKYLGRTQMHPRWYTVLFLLAFEPDVELKLKAMGWIKSRVSFYNRQPKQTSSNSSDKTNSHQAIMENVLTRLLSLLAHHPDYPDPDTAEFEIELLDFAKYIVFYLQCVATEDNISLIFHIAQRVKQTRDSVAGTIEASDKLYVLSDLAQAVIRNFADLMPAHAKGINLLQTWPGKVALPTSLFAALPSSSVAQEIAAKNYLPEDVAVHLEKLVRSMIRGGKSKDRTRTAVASEKKRKSDSVDLDDSDVERKVKKTRKSSTLPIRRTPKASKRKARDAEGEMSVDQPSRKSARTSAVKNYAESDDDEASGRDYDEVASSPIKASKSTTVSQGATKSRRIEAENNGQEEEEMPLATTVKDDDANDEQEDEGASDAGNVTNEAGEEGDNSRGSDNDDAEEQEDETEDVEMEGSPSPKPRTGRATRGTAAAPKTNGTPSKLTKSTTKAKTTPTNQAKSAEKGKKDTSAKRTSRNVDATVSTLNTTAKVKTTGKKNAVEEVPSVAASTRRSTRHAK